MTYLIICICAHPWYDVPAGCRPVSGLFRCKRCEGICQL